MVVYAQCTFLLALFAVALAVRLFNLTYHSLWFDEVISTFWAAKPAAEIWRVGLTLTQDKHPPLYYLLLRGWGILLHTVYPPVDTNDWAVRSLGALIGAAAVLPVYGIGARLGERRAGAIGALLLALNPFLVWYSQEARMFMPATTFALAGFYGVAWIAGWDARVRPGDSLNTVHFPVGSSRTRPGGGRPQSAGLELPQALLIVTGFTAALYTYLFTAFLLPAAGGWLLLSWLLARGRPGASRRHLLGMAALAVVGVLFLPLARSAWLVSGNEAVPGRAFAGMPPALWRLLQAYSLWRPLWREGMLRWATAWAALLTLAGILGPIRWGSPRPQGGGHRGEATSHPAGKATPHGRRPSGAKRDHVGARDRSPEFGLERPPNSPDSAGASAATPQGERPPRRRVRHPAGGYAKQGQAGPSGATAALPFSLLLLLWLALPILAGGVLLARDRTVFSETRYFIFLAPALCLAWGRALAHTILSRDPGDRSGSRDAPRGRIECDFLWPLQWQVRRSARVLVAVLGLALTFGILLAALPSVWAPENRREAWREAAAFVEAYAGPNDAVLVQPGYVLPAFQRYFRGPQGVYFPFTGSITGTAQVDPPLSGLAGYDAVWLVQSHHQELDPGNLVAGWFAARYPLITEAFPAGIAIHGFAQHYRTQELPPGAAVGAIPGGPLGDLRLLSCRAIEGAPTGHPEGISPRDDLFHPPSGWIHITAYWTADRPPATDLAPSARLVDASGQVWGQSLERANDAFHIWATSRWMPGEIVRADFDVNLNPDTPPGEYRLVVSVLGASGEITCGTVKVRE